MSCEISVIVKDDEKRLNKKFVVYDNDTFDQLPVRASISDPTIKKYINEVMENFDSQSQDIDVKVKIELSI